MHYVLEGKGILHTQNGQYLLEKGDVFFCLPSTPYALQSVENFQYAYVGFLGSEANRLAHEHEISIRNCTFKNLQFLFPVWQESTNIHPEYSAEYSKGLLLCTFSAISSTRQKEKEPTPKTEQRSAFLIKKYIDENFSNPELSLQSVCNALAYNSKYLSAVFKKVFRVNFKSYLNTIRLNNACALIEKGFISVKDVSFLSGFSDPLYFSKVFKEKTGITPSQYIKNTLEQKNRPNS